MFGGLHLMISLDCLDGICHLEEILGDDAPWREARSRLIAASWITGSCLHHNAAHKHGVASSGLPFLLCLETQVAALPTHVISQTPFVLCWDTFDEVKDMIYAPPSKLSLSKYKSATGWLHIGPGITTSDSKCIFLRSCQGRSQMISADSAYWL